MGYHDDPLYDDDDLLHDENYCRHGTFTGNPYGGDYMCGWCESGEEPPTQEESDRADVARAERDYDRFVEIIANVQHNPAVSFEMRAHLRQLVTDWPDIYRPNISRAWERLEAS
jgi:hypothetical protein